MTDVLYPYLPVGRLFIYVDESNPFMHEAKAWAKEHSQDKLMPNTSLIVKEGSIIGRGANGSDYHEKHGCDRVRRGVPSGHGYELCEGCHPKNHGEPRAIADAMKNGEDTRDADLYLWGHWWCCEPCWNAMIEAGIRDVYLLKDSEKLFNKNHSENIIGRQFQ